MQSEIGGEKDIFSLSWFFFDKSITNADEYYSFFVCDTEGKRLSDRVTLYDIPDDLLISNTSSNKYWKGAVRLIYEDFYNNSPLGRVFFSHIKNERDEEILGIMCPGADETSTLVLNRLNVILRELIWFRRTVIIAGCFVASVYLLHVFDLL